MRTRRSQSSSDPVSRINVHRPSTTVGGHKPVLLHEVIAALELKKGDIVVDATLGGAGHAKAIIDQLGSRGTFIGLDADTDAIARAQERLAGSKARTHLVAENFRDLAKALDSLGVATVTKVLFDLGWSSYQLDSGRGFSFQKGRAVAHDVRERAKGSQRGSDRQHVGRRVHRRCSLRLG